ncbi:ribbon-helix-helix protein, CopG family [Burkholderia sp. SRS-W-2-2016]|uniref:ribbon-helix-helix protein, CopG family n=1 Tax=Burkholderia sp. SRS-W-2-2016 TaxID=1926878 RepID=UPI00117F1115
MPKDKSAATGESSTNASCVVSARLPRDLCARVQLAAAERNQSASAFISRILREWLAAAAI